MALALSFLERCRKDGDEFLNHIVRVTGDEFLNHIVRVTGDETRVSFVNVKPKSSQRSRCTHTFTKLAEKF
jgi:hypothetical protein